MNLLRKAGAYGLDEGSGGALLQAFQRATPTANSSNTKAQSTPSEANLPSISSELNHPPREKFLRKLAVALEPQTEAIKVHAVSEIFQRFSSADAMALADKLGFGERQYLLVVVLIEKLAKKETQKAADDGQIEKLVEKIPFVKRLISKRKEIIQADKIDLPNDQPWMPLVVDYYKEFLRTRKLESISDAANIDHSFTSGLEQASRLLSRLNSFGRPHLSRSELLVHIFQRMVKDKEIPLQELRQNAEKFLKENRNVLFDFSTAEQLLSAVQDPRLATAKRPAGAKLRICDDFVETVLYLRNEPALDEILRAKSPRIAQSKLNTLAQMQGGVVVVLAARNCRATPYQPTSQEILTLSIQIRALAKAINKLLENSVAGNTDFPDFRPPLGGTSKAQLPAAFLAPSPHRRLPATMDSSNNQTTVHNGSAKMVIKAQEHVYGSNRVGVWLGNSEAAVRLFSGSSILAPGWYFYGTSAVFENSFVLSGDYKKKSELWRINEKGEKQVLHRGWSKRADDHTVAKDEAIFTAKKERFGFWSTNSVLVINDKGVKEYQFGHREVYRVEKLPAGVIQVQYRSGSKLCKITLAPGEKPDFVASDAAWAYKLRRDIINRSVVLTCADGREFRLPKEKYSLDSIVETPEGLVIKNLNDRYVTVRFSDSKVELLKKWRPQKVLGTSGSGIVLGSGDGSAQDHEHLDLKTGKSTVFNGHSHVIGANRSVLVETQKRFVKVSCLDSGNSEVQSISFYNAQEKLTISKPLPGKLGIYFHFENGPLIRLTENGFKMVCAQPTSVFSHNGEIFWSVGNGSSNSIIVFNENEKKLALPDSISRIGCASPNGMPYVLTREGDEFYKISSDATPTVDEGSNNFELLSRIQDALLHSGLYSTDREKRPALNELIQSLEAYLRTVEIVPLGTQHEAKVVTEGMQADPEPYLPIVRFNPAPTHRQDVDNLYRYAFPDLYGQASLVLASQDSNSFSLPLEAVVNESPGRSILFQLLDRSKLGELERPLSSGRCILNELGEARDAQGNKVPIVFNKLPASERSLKSLPLHLVLDSECTVPYMPGGNMEGSVSCSITSDGKTFNVEAPALRNLPYSTKKSTAQLEIKVPTKALKLTSVTNTEYENFIKGEARQSLNVEDLLRHSVELSKAHLAYLKKIEHLPPHIRVKKIISWVARNGEYDLFSHPASSNVTSQKNYLNSVMQRPSKLWLGRVLGYKHAGACEEFAQIACEMLRQSGIAAGVAGGIVPVRKYFLGPKTLLTEGARHAQPFVVWPSAEGYKVIALEATGSPKRVIAAAAVVAAKIAPPLLTSGVGTVLSQTARSVSSFSYKLHDILDPFVSTLQSMPLTKIGLAAAGTYCAYKAIRNAVENGWFSKDKEPLTVDSQTQNKGVESLAPRAVTSEPKVDMSEDRMDLTAQLGSSDFRDRNMQTPVSENASIIVPSLETLAIDQIGTLQTIVLYSMRMGLGSSAIVRRTALQSLAERYDYVLFSGQEREISGALNQKRDLRSLDRDRPSINELSSEQESVFEVARHYMGRLIQHTVSHQAAQQSFSKIVMSSHLNEESKRALIFAMHYNAKSNGVIKN